MFFKNNEMKVSEMGQGVVRKVLARGGKLMLVEVSFVKGGKGPLHSHPHEQVSYVVKGSFEFNLDGEKQVLKKGDSVYIAPDKPHSLISLDEDSIIVDTFTPQREDF